MKKAKIENENKNSVERSPISSIWKYFKKINRANEKGSVEEDLNKKDA